MDFVCWEKIGWGFGGMETTVLKSDLVKGRPFRIPSDSEWSHWNAVWYGIVSYGIVCPIVFFAVRPWFSVQKGGL